MKGFYVNYIKIVVLYKNYLLLIIINLAGEFILDFFIEKKRNTEFRYNKF